MAFEPDWAEVRENFRRMTREALLEELALRADEYTPMARKLLEGEALARGITAADIEAARAAPTPEDEQEVVDHPQLITSRGDLKEAQEVVALLRRKGIAALVRELNRYPFQQIGLVVGDWGVFVPGPRAPEAGRLLDALFPPPPAEPCESEACGSCELPPETEEDPFPEEGDWWKTGGNEEKDP